MRHTVSKAFILGAGLGTRLRPLTNSLPKPLVPFGHEPLVYNALRHCQKAGIQSFAINTHHCPEAWEKTFPNNQFEGSPLHFFHEPELLETGGGIKNIATYIGDEPTLIYNGDILTDLDLAALCKSHCSSNNLATLALYSKGPNCNVAVNNGQVIDIRHTLGIHPGTHQFTGIYIIEAEVLDLIPTGQKISIIPALVELTKLGRLGTFIADGATWQDLGTRDEYLSAHRRLRQSKLFKAQHPSAKVDPSADVDLETCFIGANCVIEKNVILRNTIVWPAAKVLKNSNLNNCIVYQSASGNHSYCDL